ncbi:MAG: HAMP domain-containing protein [Clostridia bacterium]|nr:HAMP domain-containing protein [Clostridia bacterium]
MHRGLYFKIILILVVFILIVMSVVGAVLIANVLDFYNDEFSNCMAQNFGGDGQLRVYLENAMENADMSAAAQSQKAILASYSSRLGIDDYRSYYILDANGSFLAGSDAQGGSIAKTPNLVAAIGGEVGSAQNQGLGYADYALPLSKGDSACIIYIRDTQEELQEVTWMLFSIILQALLVGLVIAFILSFFLARAISLPLSKLTEGVQRVAKGNFAEKINVQSNDEIGVLTENFNRMSSMIEENLDEISGERENLATVLSCLKDAVITFGDDGKPLQINDAAKKLFSAADLDGLSLDYIFSLLHYEKSDIDIDLDDAANVPAVQYNGRVYELYFGNIRYRNAEKMREGIIVVIHDVTQSYELDRSRREFVANASHELRTPLTTIKMVLESLAGDETITANEMTKSFLSMAETESSRMEALIKNLLTLSQLDSRTMQLNIKPINITDSLTSIAKTLAYTAEKKGQTLAFDGVYAPMTVNGDKIRLEQIIINIVSNAIKYTGEGGKIRLRLRDAGENVEIIVADTGMGIPKEDLPRLFERFYRVEKARSSDKGGTGLGLAIAKEFALAHGGDIHVASELGKGTVFTIVLPKG